MGLKPLPGERGLYEQATGPYSAIVYKNGELTVAEDSRGGLITEGTDASTVIQQALEKLGEGIVIKVHPAEYTITKPIEILYHGQSISGDGGRFSMPVFKASDDFNTDYPILCTKDILAFIDGSID